MRTLVLALAAACLVLAVAACGGGGAQSAGRVPAVPVKEVSADALTFELWFIGYDNASHGCCTVFSTSRTAEELGIPHVGANFAVGPHLIERLVEALIEGPSPEETAFGFASAIHTDTRLLGVSVENGIVTVDLTSEFQCAQVQGCDSRFEAGGGFERLGGLFVLAQVVYTVTQFPDVEGVRFELDGRPAPVPPGKVLEEHAKLRLEKILAEERLRELLDRPVTRQDYENALHPITFSAPVIGSGLASPVRIAGTANVPDGTVTAVLLDAPGSVIAKRVARVACGAGCRGNYAIEIPFEVSERQSGVIQVRYEGAMIQGYEGPPCTTSPWCWTHEIPVTLLP